MLAKLWLLDPEFGGALARIDWVADGLDSAELPLIWYARRLSGVHPDIARNSSLLLLPEPAVIDIPYDEKELYVTLLYLVNDFVSNRSKDIATDPIELVNSLVSDTRAARGFTWIAARDTEVALFAAEQLKSVEGDLLAYAALSMGSIALGDGLKHIKLLVSQPWFVDGLTNEEAALITILNAPSSYPGIYTALLQSHSAQTETISTPISGEVRIWAIKNGLFHRNLDWIGGMADTVRIMEEFLGIPIPTTDIILEVIDWGAPGYGGPRGFHVGSYMHLREDRYGSIYHETAHYYFSGGPKWFGEGGAEFAEAYIRDRKGIEDVDNRKANTRLKSSSCVEDQAIENLMHYNQHVFYFPAGCAYSMGEHFLFSIMDIIGEKALGAALGEIIVLAREGRIMRDYITELAIYDIFLKHTPPGLRDEFRSVYNALHGGPNLPNPPDDHPDDIHAEVIAKAAKQVAIGESVSGVLDYRYDTDLFAFEAKEGVTYRVAVAHDALRAASVWVYDDYWGNGPLQGDRERGAWRTERALSGPQAFWVAPASGRYYAGVENFGGHSGSYTLTITVEEGSEAAASQGDER